MWFTPAPAHSKRLEIFHLDGKHKSILIIINEPHCLSPIGMFAKINAKMLLERRINSDDSSVHHTDTHTRNALSYSRRMYEINVALSSMPMKFYFFRTFLFCKYREFIDPCSCRVEKLARSESNSLCNFESSLKIRNSVISNILF